MSEETKKCKECQSDIPKNAKRCPNCTADQRSWFSRHPILTFLILLIGTPILIATMSDTGTSGAPTSNTQTITPQSTWEYKTSTDEFSDTKQSFASLLSSNKLNFDFPYNGGSQFVLVIRNLHNNKGEEALIKVDKGQFLTYEETIKVRFDDGEPVTYNISGSADGSADTIFIRNSSSFISNVKQFTN